jgi:hypothetical protein
MFEGVIYQADRLLLNISGALGAFLKNAHSSDDIMVRSTTGYRRGG